MTEWSNRPLDEVYAAVFIDAIVVKVRDGQVANRPIYAAIGVSLAGEKDILGLWAGTGGEGAKFWMSVLTDLTQPRRRGRVLRGLRRPERPARGGRQRVAAGDRADLHHPPDPQHLPAGLQAGLGRAQARRQAHLHRGQRRRGPGRVRRARRASGGSATRRSSGCGTTPGKSSSRSWTTTSRSARCSAPPTRSSRSTPATGGRSRPAATSRPSRPR